MYWPNFIHIYQPPTQNREIVEKVAIECYRPMVRILLEHPNGKLTLNINACLTEQLWRYGFSDVIDCLGELAERGQIEFTGSAKFHPILPLIPEKEVTRQVRLNEDGNRRFFEDLYQPRGFFPPEMCYSRGLAEIVKGLGYSWIIVDELSFNGKLGQVRTDTLYEIHDLKGFMVYFKERRVSAGITYGRCKDLAEFKEFIKGELQMGGYLLSGTDGEVYGHHRPGQERLLEQAFKDPDIRACRISDLEHLFPKREVVDPLPSSWSTWEDEMEEGVPYPQWDYPGNELHRLQWELARLAIEAVHETDPSIKGWSEARTLLDEGLHSCQWWWASCRPWWDTGMINLGAQVLFKSISAIGNETLIERAKALVMEIQEKSREWHESGRARELKEQYMEAHRDVTSLLSFG